MSPTGRPVRDPLEVDDALPKFSRS